MITLASWSRERRAVAKVEWLPGLRGRNARYVVTNISRKTLRARELYEQRYCARGAMENRIKDQQLWRASAHIMRASMHFLAFTGATVRRVRLCLASTFPLQDVFARTLVNLRVAAQAPPG